MIIEFTDEEVNFLLNELALNVYSNRLGFHNKITPFHNKKGELEEKIRIAKSIQEKLGDNGAELT